MLISNSGSEHFNSPVELNHELFLNGALNVKQPSKGYRYSIDAVILANSIRPMPKQKVVDLGTGCGIISLILSYRNPDIHITGVEIQKSLSELAVENVIANGMEDRIRILCKNLKSLELPRLGEAVDWVISNPPYRKLGAGRIGGSIERTLAMHEVAMTLEDLLAAAKRILKEGGYFALVYPSERFSDLICRMREFGIEPKSIRSIHPQIGTDAKRILVVGKKGGKPGVSCLPPLIIYKSNGAYSEEIKPMFLP